MKVLLVHPGASWSVADVWSGVGNALRRAGVEVTEYSLDRRLEYWNQWFKYLKRKKPDVTYNAADIVYGASLDVITRYHVIGADWCIIISGTYLHPEAMKLYRKAGLKVCSILTETPYADLQEQWVAEFSDIVYTNERTKVDYFAQWAPCYYWQHAYEPAIHSSDLATTQDVASHEVVFVGTGFEERVKLFNAVNWDGIDFGLYGGWYLVGSRARLRKHIRGGITYNGTTAELYRRAKIGISHHRSSCGFGRGVPQIEHAESMGPRCYELAATGCFFVSDYRAEVDEVFGGVIPIYHDANELEKLLRYFLEDETIREEIACEAQAAIKPHTFDARVKGLLEVLS